MRSLTLTLHYIAGWALVLASLALVAFYVPQREENLGGSYLIFFWHFPSAIGCLLFFILSGLASIAWMANRSETADRMALAAVEVGILGCTITMVTGSIWARAAWGLFWVWSDPRLMTVAILWFTYLAYLALRASIDFPAQRARFSAVFGIIALINIPMVHFAIKIFGPRSHPMKLEADPEMRVTMWFGALAFLVLYSAFWRSRLQVARLRDEEARIQETFAVRGI